MHWRNRLCLIVAALCVSLAAAPAAAQEDSPEKSQEKSSKKAEASEQSSEEETEDGTAETKTDTKQSESADEEKDSDSETSDSKESNSEKADEGDKKRESAHGSYEWKPSFGGGVEYGLFFNDLSRWNKHLLSPNGAKPFDVAAISSITIAAEASVLEGSRFTAFGSFDTAFSGNPKLTAIYGGLEPAFAFRRNFWEMALGFGVGVGGIHVSTDQDKDFDAGLLVLRPALEIRRYIGEVAAGYLRVGFNQWLPFKSRPKGLTIEQDANQNGEGPGNADENLLYEGGVFAALGVRFGHYPEHKKVVPDTDGDGLRDDIDDCKEQKEDKDDFEDWDGCPDADNDGDGVEDDADNCPNEPEDIDEWEDEDGCPEEDDDHDRDGILTEEDECPRKAEDKDGFEDEDGCPDKDNDQDGIPDADDDCPDKVGIPAEEGCPSEIVKIEKKRLAVSKPIAFQAEAKDKEGPRTVLTDAAKKTLDEVAQVLAVHTELAKVEIQAHTEKGDEKAKKTESEKRAKAVRDYLVDAKVDSGRLTTKGLGFSEPSVPEKAKKAGEKAEPTPTSRVEFLILKRQEKPDEEKADEKKADEEKETEKAEEPKSKSDEDSESDE